MNSNARFAGVALFGFFIATLGMAQTPSTSKPKQAPRQQAAPNPWDALSRTGENHRRLAGLVGTWSFTGKHSDPKGPSLVFSGTEVRRALWENRYFLGETTGGAIPMPWADGRAVLYQDMMTEGYDNQKKKFFRTLIDNHLETGLVLFEGTYDPETRSFTYLGEGESPFGKDILHLRVTVLDEDHYKEELSVKGDNGNDSGVTEIKYTRIKEK